MFPSVPKRTRATISFPGAGGLLKNCWVFVSPCDLGSSAPTKYTGRASSWEGLLPSSPSCWPPACTSLGPLGQASGSSSLLGILGLVPASDIAVSLVYRLVAVFVPPAVLPKFDLAEGIPPELRTIVVVPTLLISHPQIKKQCERLEVHYLANPKGHLHFALLTDWEDAPRECMPGDEELLATAVDGIARLNERYEGPIGGGGRFLLLHRRRLWNEQEGKWISWERKRGKLHELNRLLRSAKDTTFIPISGQTPALPRGVRYVITLDADTLFPKGTAYRLVGAMAHPLNRPRLDPRKGRVVEGYAILQPRITPSLVRRLSAQRDRRRPLRGCLFRRPSQDHAGEPVPDNHPGDRSFPQG